MSDKELDNALALTWAKRMLTISDEHHGRGCKCAYCCAARYIFSTATADPPQSVVTLTLADYEALKARAEGMFAKATLTAWSEANEFAVQAVELLRRFCDRKNERVHIDVYDKASELIDQWDRRHKTVTTEGDVPPEGATGTL